MRKLRSIWGSRSRWFLEPHSAREIAAALFQAARRAEGSLSDTRRISRDTREQESYPAEEGGSKTF